jgi:hypothetical protein
VGEQPLERVAEDGDERHVGLVGAHPLEGVRPVEVGRAGVAEQAVHARATGGGVVSGVVRRRPVHRLVVEVVALLVGRLAHQLVLVERDRERRRAALLHADDREVVGHRPERIARRGGI